MCEGKIQRVGREKKKLGLDFDLEMENLLELSLDPFSFQVILVLENPIFCQDLQKNMYSIWNPNSPLIFNLPLVVVKA